MTTNDTAPEMVTQYVDGLGTERVFQHRRKGRIVGVAIQQNGTWLCVRLTEDHPQGLRAGEQMTLRTTLLDSVVSR